MYVNAANDSPEWRKIKRAIYRGHTCFRCSSQTHSRAHFLPSVPYEAEIYGTIDSVLWGSQDPDFTIAVGRSVVSLMWTGEREKKENPSSSVRSVYPPRAYCSQVLVWKKEEKNIVCARVIKPASVQSRKTLFNFNRPTVLSISSG